MLPPSVIEIIGLIGETEAQQLIKHLGGMNYYFPDQSVNRNIACISHESWQILCSRYSGSYLFIPKCYKAILHQRNTLIRDEREKGASIQALCRKFNLTDRQIVKICGKEVNKDQLDWLNPIRSASSDINDVDSIDSVQPMKVLSE